MDKYTLIERLGTGGEGDVVLARRIADSEVFVMKIKKYPSIDEANFGLKEGIVMARMRHRFVVECVDVFISTIPPKIPDANSTSLSCSSCQDLVYLCIVLEYCKGGNLYDKLLKHMISEQTIQRYMLEIAEGLNAIHNENIVHRDLKLQNILLDGMDNIKICDFGLSSTTTRIYPSSVNKLIRSHKPKSTLSSSLPSRFKGIFDFPGIGTADYLPPEIFVLRQEQRIDLVHYTQAVDVWAFACICYEIATGDLQIFHELPEPLGLAKLTDKATFDATIVRISTSLEELNYDSIKDLILSILTASANDRPSIKTILKHECLTNRLSDGDTSIQEEATDMRDFNSYHDLCEKEKSPRVCARSLSGERNMLSRCLSRVHHTEAKRLLNGVLCDDVRLEYYFPNAENTRKYLSNKFSSVLVDYFIEKHYILGLFVDSYLVAVALLVGPNERINNRIQTQSFIKKGGCSIATQQGGSSIVQFNKFRKKFVKNHYEKHMKNIPHYWLFYLAVRKDLQNKGFGTKLLQELFEWSDGDGIPLSTTLLNYESKEFFSKYFPAVNHIRLDDGPEYWEMIRWPKKT